jgi:putative redox protein
MIRTSSTDEAWQTWVSNGRHGFLGDAPVDKGGGGQGLGAHELLEAALALCMNMSVRMHARAHSIPLTGVQATVRLARPADGEVVFEYRLELAGTLDPAQRRELEEVAASCPVRRTLSQRLGFVPVA